MHEAPIVSVSATRRPRTNSAPAVVSAERVIQALRSHDPLLHHEKYDEERAGGPLIGASVTRKARTSDAQVPEIMIDGGFWSTASDRQSFARGGKLIEERELEALGDATSMDSSS